MSRQKVHKDSLFIKAGFTQRTMVMGVNYIPVVGVVHVTAPRVLYVRVMCPRLKQYCRFTRATPRLNGRQGFLLEPLAVGERAGVAWGSGCAENTTDTSQTSIRPPWMLPGTMPRAVYQAGTKAGNSVREIALRTAGCTVALLASKSSTNRRNAWAR